MPWFWHHHLPQPLVSLALSCLGVALLATAVATTSTLPDPSSWPNPYTLQTVLCRGRCIDGCQTFLTPLGACFNGRSRFPYSPSWSKYDVLDVVMLGDEPYAYVAALSVNAVTEKQGQVLRRHKNTPSRSTTSPALAAAGLPDTFYRYIFDSSDGSCGGNATDAFVLPTHVCVGPFGRPRPWGNFSIVVSTKD